MIGHDPYCPDPLTPRVFKAQQNDEMKGFSEVSDLRVLEVHALCRIADYLTTLTTLEMNR